MIRFSFHSEPSSILGALIENLSSSSEGSSRRRSSRSSSSRSSSSRSSSSSSKTIVEVISLQYNSSRNNNVNGMALVVVLAIVTLMAHEE